MLCLICDSACRNRPLSLLSVSPSTANIQIECTSVKHKANHNWSLGFQSKNLFNKNLLTVSINSAKVPDSLDCPTDTPLQKLNWLLDSSTHNRPHKIGTQELQKKLVHDNPPRLSQSKLQSFQTGIQLKLRPR
jgi:hypothetical protein